jgi:hypothetical protein
MEMTLRLPVQAIGTRSLIWLLLLAVVLMSFSVARQQALGSLHQHTDAELRSASTFTSTFSAAASSLASHWMSRRQQQQVFGHGQLQVGVIAAPALWAASARRDTRHNEDHHHDTLERHYHALGDDSVIALDGAAEAAETGSVGAVVLLPMLASPSQGLVVATTTGRKGSWPVQGGVRFASMKVAPLLRPPAA